MIVNVYTVHSIQHTREMYWVGTVDEGWCWFEWNDRRLHRSWRPYSELGRQPLDPMVRWTIVDRRTGQPCTVTSFRSAEAARDAIKVTRERFDAGHRFDLADLIDHLEPRIRIRGGGPDTTIVVSGPPGGIGTANIGPICP